MALVKRKADKKATRTAWIIAIAFHAILAWIFYQFGGGKEIIQDFVAEITQGIAPPPPPPPPPPKHSIDMAKPTNITPKFEIKTNVALQQKEFNINFTSTTMDMEVGTPDFGNLARSYSTQNFNVEKTSMVNATNLIQDIFDVGIAGPSTGRRTEVRGVGTRMRAKLNFTLIATPGAVNRTYLFEAAGGGYTDVYRSTTAYWDYMLRLNTSVENARSWLRENTHILVNENTLSLDYRYTYEEWCDQIRSSGPQTVDSLSEDYAVTSLALVSRGVYALYTDRTKGPDVFADLVRQAYKYYVGKKFQVNLLGKDGDSLVREISEREPLRKWRVEELKRSYGIYQGLKAGGNVSAQLNYVKPLYLFLQKSRVLENPLVLICNVVGVDRIPKENLEVLRNYAWNGGFIWVDESGLADISQRQDIMCRTFISQLLDSQRKQGLDEAEEKVYGKLKAEDRAVTGFKLGDYFPEVLNHPEIFIPVTLPRRNDVVLRIYNRMGILVRVFDRRNVEAGNYNLKETAFFWDCTNNSGEPVESGLYFYQLESGIFKKTRPLYVSQLRRLDASHPLFSVVHRFQDVPVCTIENSSTSWVPRVMGPAAFGYYMNNRMVLLYTESTGIIGSFGEKNNAVVKTQACRWLNNVIAYCLQDENGITNQP